MASKSHNIAQQAIETISQEIWDVMVIGGGPAGMMAASTAASGGRKVLLLEKNDTLGKKLLITGGGRCNLTNAELDIHKLLPKYKEAEPFLFTSFAQFGVEDTFSFFNSRGVATKIEAEKRAFPQSDSAKTIWETLVKDMQKTGVTVLSHQKVTGLVVEEGEVVGVKAITQTSSSTSVKTSVQSKEKEQSKNSSQLFKAESIIIATGGTSRPETGSTGDAYNWLKSIGHTIVKPEPSLVPIKIKNQWVKKLQGITLKDIKISLFRSVDTGKGMTIEKEAVKKGKILFTHFGVSGPTILNMSKQIGEILKYDDALLMLDVLPGLDHGQLNTTLQELFKNDHTKKIKNALPALIPSALVSYILEKAHISEDTICNSITREKRLALIEVLKNLSMEVEGLLGKDKAIITSGGVEISEIDFKTMQSKKMKNVFIVGDVLNIDRPSGGYSLQLCWTTGFIAGKNA